MIRPLETMEKMSQIGDAFKMGHASCLTVFFDRPGGVPQEIIYRPDLTVGERRTYNSHLVAATLVESLLQDKPPSCPLCWLGVEHDRVYCGEQSAKAMQLGQALKSVDGGVLEREWIRVRQAKP
jgi:hypothetical protein